jgi:hypothetical protein
MSARTDQLGRALEELRKVNDRVEARREAEDAVREAQDREAWASRA